MFSTCDDRRGLLSSPPTQRCWATSMVPAGIFPKLPRFPTSIPAVFPLISGFLWDFLRKAWEVSVQTLPGCIFREHRIEPKRHHVISFGNVYTSGQDGHCPPRRVFTDQQPAGHQYMEWPVNPSWNHFRTVSCGKACSKSKPFP